MKNLIMLFIATFMLFSCTKPKIKPQPAVGIVCEYHKQYEKFFMLNTHSNIAFLVNSYGQEFFEAQFIVESDTIWNIYDNGSIEYLPPNSDTVSYTYFDAVGAIDERYVYKRE